MTVVIVVVVLVLLVALAVAFARAGAREHPEALNTHAGDDPSTVSDRPAGPGAEAMGVDRPGEPGLGGDADARRRPK